MDDPTRPDDAPSELRRRALAALDAQGEQERQALGPVADERAGEIDNPVDSAAESAAESARVLHELRVHQIELEMQNEELRRAQLELETSRERWFDLYELAPVGYCSVSEAGLIVQLNLAAAELLGLSRSELAQRRFVQLVDPADLVTFHALRARALETGEREECELRLLAASGAPRWVQLSATSATELEGQRTLRVVLVDVTERRKADAAQAALRVAEQTRRNRDELLSRVSHELRTPLNAILGFSSMLLMTEQTRAQPDVRQQLQYIHDAGTHLLQLVVDVLDMSRLTAGNLALQLTTIDPRELLRSAVREIEADAGSRGISIQLQVPEPGLPVALRADPTRLRQVLLNLLSNAVKYNRPQGHVSARMTRVGGHWRLAIADDGMGMSAQQLSALFRPFDRLGREAQGFDGTGLGLVIVRELVDRMGGVLTVRSETNGGSEFLVDLVAAQPESAVGGTVLASVAGSVAGSVAETATDTATATATETALQLRTDITGRVLCVEDDGRARQLMDLVLARRPGLTLELVATGKEGMAAARRAWPDLLILDQRLPDMAGLDLLRVLRQLNPHLPMSCIVASAEAAPAAMVRARAAGADEYLVKPIYPGQLLSLVDKLLSRRSGQRPAAA